MRRVAVFYATREGQTQKIAEHVAGTLRKHGIAVHVRNVCYESGESGLADYDAAILAASVHTGRHEREMVRFVKHRLTQLVRLPTAFLSVTLSQAGAERTGASPQERARSSADAQRVMETFFQNTGWRPDDAKAVAGALLYTKYNLFVRFIMKRIAKSAGGDTDTSRDYEYTDWAALDRFVEQWLDNIARAEPIRHSPAKFEATA